MTARDLIMDTIALLCVVVVFLLAPLGAGSLLDPAHDRTLLEVRGTP